MWASLRDKIRADGFLYGTEYVREAVAIESMILACRLMGDMDNGKC